MKLRLTTRPLLNYSNPYRIIPSNTLYIRYINCIFISHPYLPRRKQRMINPISSRQRCFHVLYLLIHTRRTRNLLWILPIPRNMKHRNYPFIRCYSYCFHRLCATMRPNIILRSYRNYKLIISNSLHRYHPSRMNLRWIFSRQSYSNPVLRISLHPTIHRSSPNNSSPTISTRNWIKQPIRIKLRRRQNPIPPILHCKRPSWSPNTLTISTITYTILTRLTRRPR